jgi:hypothetical protein
VLIELRAATIESSTLSVSSSALSPIIFIHFIMHFVTLITLSALILFTHSSLILVLFTHSSLALLLFTCSSLVLVLFTHSSLTLLLFTHSSLFAHSLLFLNKPCFYAFECRG